MKLDLSKIELFEESEIKFDKKISFIFGSNGTGKTTIADECKR